MPKTEEMVRFMKFWMKVEDGGEGNLRKWNAVGSPILPDLRVEHLELVADAGGGVGYRLGQAEHALATHKEVAMPHEREYDAHVHKEVAALVSVVEKEGPQHMNARVLAKVDASATVSLVRRGASASSVLDGLAKRLWNACMKYGWTM